ncbi:MAG: hypothetical protein WCK47_07925 [bacterium]
MRTARAQQRPESNPWLFAGKRYLFFKALAFSVVAISIWLLINVTNLREYVDTYNRRNEELQQIQTLEQRIGVLKKERLGLQTSGFELERRVREQWPMKRPGEHVIYLRPDDNAPSTASIAALINAKSAAATTSETTQEKRPKNSAGKKMAREKRADVKKNTARQ